MASNSRICVRIQNCLSLILIANIKAFLSFLDELYYFIDLLCQTSLCLLTDFLSGQSQLFPSMLWPELFWCHLVCRVTQHKLLLQNGAPSAPCPDTLVHGPWAGVAAEEPGLCTKNQSTQSLLTAGQKPFRAVEAAQAWEQGLPNAFGEQADPVSNRRLSSRNHSLAPRASEWW